MLAVIANQTGRIYHAAGLADLQQTRPTYAFVPLEHFSAKSFQKGRYLASTWPSINANANPNAIGSHILPDVAKPVSQRSKCAMLAEFITRLQSIAAIKSVKHP